MIDIDTPEAQAKLTGLPSDILDILMELWHELCELEANARSYARIVNSVAKRQREQTAMLRVRIVKSALNAAIVAAFEPLTAPDQSGEAARILGGDV